MINYDELVNKHYTLQNQRSVKPLEADKPFHPFEGFGIECGEGWFGLLDELCAKIEAILDKMPAKARKAFGFDQIKEKFAGLRIYAHGETEEISNIIGEYEEKSFAVCEKCGAEGRHYIIRGWHMTLCKECAGVHLLKWQTETLKSIIETEKTIRELNSMDKLNKEQITELNEAKDWLKISREVLDSINKQLNIGD